MTERRVAGRTIELVEVGPRDGLQNETRPIGTKDKVTLIEKLIDAGLHRIEAVSFVNPRRVPQMADAEAVMDALPKRKDVTYIGLVLNAKGAQRALRTAVNELGAVAVASDSFGLRNQKQSIEDSVNSALEIVQLAREHGRSAQACIAMAFGCPFEGRIVPARVVEIAERLARGSPREIALADTIGEAVPREVKRLVSTGAHDIL